MQPRSNYKKIGFRNLPVEAGVYKRANVKMIMELDKMETLVAAPNKELNDLIFN